MYPNTLPSIGEGLGKGQIAELAKQSVDNVLDHGNVFQVAEAIAAMEEFAKHVRRDERFVDFLRDELMKHHGRVKTRSGAKIEHCEAGVNYDYSQDCTWRSLDEEIRLLAEKKKVVEDRLRQIGPGRIAVDPETGEVSEGPSKTSKSTYRITLTR